MPVGLVDYLRFEVPVRQVRPLSFVPSTIRVPAILNRPWSGAILVGVCCGAFVPLCLWRCYRVREEHGRAVARPGFLSPLAFDDAELFGESGGA